MLPVRLGASLKVIQVIHVFCWSIFIFETNEEDFLNLDAEPPAQQKSVYVTHKDVKDGQFDKNSWHVRTCSILLFWCFTPCSMTFESSRRCKTSVRRAHFSIVMGVYLIDSLPMKRSLQAVCYLHVTCSYHPPSIRIPRKSLLRAKHKVFFTVQLLVPLRPGWAESELVLWSWSKSELHWKTCKKINHRWKHHSYHLISIKVSSRFKLSSSQILRSAPLPRSSCRCPGSSRSKGSTFDIANIRSELSFDLCRSSFFSVIFSWEFARLFVTGQIWGRCCIAKTSRIPAVASLVRDLRQ